jgi:broad specificity phosphatase PhoE
MKLILTRHGETEENLAGIIQGHLPGKLSKNGISQAKKVALRLKDERIDYIYSSDLARAADTAKEIARYHPNVPIKYVKELRERNHGEFEGKKRSEVEYTYIDSHESGPRGGESHKALFDRANAFLHEVLSKHIDDNILFVGHGTINKAMIAAITGKSHTEFVSMEHQHNTSISIFEIDENIKHRIHVLNCIKHLE